MKKMFNKAFIAATVLSCLSAPAFAEYDINVPNNNNPMYHYEVLQNGEVSFYGEKTTSNFTIKELETIINGTGVWADVIKYSSGPALIGLGRLKKDGAYAQSEQVEVFTDASQKVKKEYFYPAVYAALNNEYYEMSEHQDEESKRSKKVYSANIMIGNANSTLGYSDYNENTALYQQKADSLRFTIQHEIGHTLGVSSNAGEQDQDKPGFYQFSSAEYDDDGKILPATSGKITIFDKYLRVYDLELKKEVSAGRGMIINADPETSKSDYGVNKDYVFDLAKGSPYFVGPKTMQVLAGVTDDELSGKNEDEIIKYCQDKIIAKGGIANYSSAYDEAKLPKVYGLPIHPHDYDTVDVDLSHTELRNSMMSHQPFSNWATFMEAELAVLKDIGYNIDLSEYFGKSYYLDDITDTVKLNNDTFTKDFAIGVHVYGNRDTITQKDTDITSSGNASFGVRIDGSNDTYNMVNSDISLTGANSIGFGVTYGKGNTVDVDEDSSISVTGDNDVAVSFDFGKNVQSEAFGTRGSYIYHNGDNNVKPTPDNQGALVSEFNLDGKISATGNNSTAIYISDNAHVENININDGAKIEGNIVSAWNSVKSGSYASVQYETEGGDWEEQDPQNPANWHYTNLNINSNNFAYTGNILGDSKYEYENKTYTGNTLKLNVAAGKLLDISGDDATYQVYTIANKGTINVQKNLDLSVMNGKITETGGIIKLANNANLYLHSNVKNIENTVNLGDGALLSTINEGVSDLAIKELIVSDKPTPTNKSKVSFDLGDTFSIENPVDEDAEIKNIYVNKAYAESLANGKTYKLFTNKDIDLGESSINFYYGGKKYNLAQKSDDKSSIITSDVSEAGITYDLSDAIRDNSTINYVVANGEKQLKTAGEIQQEEFEILGADLNFNGHGGLIVNGAINKKVTMLKTSAYGAPTNLTVQGAGKLLVYSSDKAIGLGNENEIALDIKGGSTVLLNSEKENQINVFGDIKGNNKDTDKLITNGYAVNIYNIDPITVYANAEYTGLYGISDNVDWNLTNGTLYVEKDENLSQKGNNSIIFNGGALNLQNNQASQINLANMTLGTTSPVSIDVDFNTMKADRFAIKNTLTANNNVLYIKSVNILNANTPLSLDYYEIPFVNSSLNNTGLLNHVNLASTVEQEVLTPILKYNLGYSEQSGKGNFTLSRTQYGGYDDYNPAIAVSSVAQQGMYLTQLNTYDQAFANMDMTMLMTKDQRTAWKNANKLAAQDANNGVVTYSPNQFPEENRGVWFRPFASFENVNLNDGPRTDNISYGGLVGGDSDLITFKAPLLGNVDMIWGAYAGYNGSHQTYQGNSIYQNGGTLGLNAAFYWKNFFTGITANVGASAGDASTMYGKEYMAMLAGGIAGKMGYNWELFKGRFIVQPSLLMSATLVNTFDYTNAAGVRMHNCCPLLGGQLAPGLKFIGNLKHGWQPYANVQMMWNIMDNTRFKANDAHLSEMSVDPYIQYGVGLQKRWGDRFTGFGQIMMRNGGRNGISFNAGFRYELGKNGSNSAKKAAVKHYTQKNISLTAK